METKDTMEQKEVQSYNDANEMSVGDWIVTYLIMIIPIINIIMLFMWAFGDTAFITKKNWAKGNLILIAFITAAYLFFGLIVGIGYFFNA